MHWAGSVDDVYTYYESTSLPNVPTLHIMYGAQYVHSSRAAMIEKSWVCTTDRAASYCDQAELRSWHTRRELPSRLG